MNKEVFVNVMVNKAKALSQIRFWDSIERVSPFFIEDLKARRVALEEYKKWASMEETSCI